MSGQNFVQQRWNWNQMENMWKKVEFIIKFKLTFCAFFAPVFFVRICNQSILGIFAKILYLSDCGKYAQIWKLASVSDF